MRVFFSLEGLAAQKDSNLEETCKVFFWKGFGSWPKPTFEKTCQLGRFSERRLVGILVAFRAILLHEDFSLRGNLNTDGFQGEHGDVGIIMKQKVTNLGHID